MLFVTRSARLEILDGDNFTPEELEGNLADLDRFHRMARGASLIRRALAEAAGGSDAPPRSLLDVGAGAMDLTAEISSPAGEGFGSLRGDRGGAPGRGGSERAGCGDGGGGEGEPGGKATETAPRAMRREDDSGGGPPSGPRVVAADLHPWVLARARGRSQPGVIRLCAADARSLPFADRSFDLAWSSLLLHHLDDAGIVAALAGMKRVTRMGFVVSDLRRSALAFAAVWALTRLTSRNRITLHDGPLSVRRALTPPELRSLAEDSGLEPRAQGEASGFNVRPAGIARLLLVYRHPPLAA